MLRPRPEPSDLAASLVPRVGDTPFAPGVPREAYTQAVPRPFVADRCAGLSSVLAQRMMRTGSIVLPPSPAREAADAAEQQAIADAVEGVLP